MHRIRTPWQRHLIVLLAYALLALALTWPLAARFSSHVPGDGADDPPLTWNLWWIRYSLLDLGSNPFDCDYLFYPIGINLAFYTLTLLNGILSIPLQSVLGLVPASNVLLLSSFVLGGYGAFLLASHVLRAISNAASPDLASADRPSRGWGIVPASAFGAGMVYAFSSSKLFYAALGQWNIASSQWIPFYVLSLLRLGQHPQNRRRALLAAVFLLLQTYAEMTYASFLVLFTVLWAIWTLLVRARRSERTATSWPLAQLALSLITLSLVFVLGITPLLAMMIPDMLVEGNVFAEGGGFAEEFSADLVGFGVPIMHHPVLGNLVQAFGFPHKVGQHLYFGYSVLLMAVLGTVCLWRRCSVRFWSVSALVFWLLTMGPTLQANGLNTGLPLPFQLLAKLPFFEGNRYPSRYSVMLTLSLAVLVGYGLLCMLRSTRGPAAPPHTTVPFRRTWLWCVGPAVLACVAMGLFLFEHLSVPMPLSDMTVPPVYQIISTELPEGAAVLDIPVAWRNGSRVTGTEDTIIMFEQYYQTVHQAPILAGNTSRNPPFKFQYFTEAPIISTLIALETGHVVDSSVLGQDRTRAPSVLRFFSIASIIVHPSQVGSGVATYIENTMPVERIYTDANALAYRVNLPPWPQAWSATPGSDLGGLSFAEGWGVPGAGIIWAQRRTVRLLVPADGSAQRMAFEALAPGDGQELVVELNGRRVAAVQMRPGWGSYELVLPEDMVTEGLNELRLRFRSLYDAEQAEIAPKSIGTTGIGAPVNLAVKSAGYEVGDLARIYVNGRDVGANERGYNLAVIDAQDGHVDATASFDTHADPDASYALAAFLNQVPLGKIVIAAAADEASMMLGQEAVDALARVGASGDLRQRFRWGHAIVGVQGAAPGTAMEAMDWMRPVTLVVGEGFTEPKAAAAFSSIVLSATSEQEQP